MNSRKYIGLVAALIVSSSAVAQNVKLLDLATKWKFTIGDRQEYASPSYDDSSWENIRVPSTWEDQGFLNYNGFAWYRISFYGEDLEGYENLSLNLGYIDDVHEAYINGKLVGFKGSFPPKYYTAYDALNIYAIPEESINRTGKNTIAVKVYDLTLGGGIVRGNIGIFFTPKLSGQYHSLEGVWKFSTRRKSDWETLDFDHSRWDNIVVPSFWRSKYIRFSSGYGWYRKEFELPESLKGKDLLLLLGKIDDFDYTYVNGQIVGRTKDNLPFGESNSWEEFRIYRIPKEKLNQNGKNVIAVQVEDIGIDAGIYDGPIGLVPEDISRKSLDKIRD